MKAWRDECGITSVLCQIWSRASRGLFVVALLQARGTTIANSPPLPRPTQSRARPADCYGQSRGGKNNIFPQTRGLTLPQAGTGQILELPSPPWQGWLCPHTYCPTAGLGMWLSPAIPWDGAPEAAPAELTAGTAAAAVPLGLCPSVSPGQWG